LPLPKASVSYEERDPYRLAQKIRAWSTKDPTKVGEVCERADEVLKPSMFEETFWV
jgi:hypothetical protein